MRDRRPCPLAAVTLAAGCLLAGAASAQVTTNRSALDALGSGHRAPAATHHAAARHPSAGRDAHHAHAAPRPADRSTHPARIRAVNPHPPAATIPQRPPPPPVFVAPVINVPLHPPPPPPPVPVVQGAQGVAAPIEGGVRIGFGAGGADLNPATLQALQGFAGQLKADPLARADLDAYSAGTADDPSTPRRVALSRGLAARAVLINAGIPATRIYVRTFGQAPATDPGAPPDRVDLHLSRNPNAAPAPAAAATVPAAPRPASSAPP